jgi:hypothetical protein
VEETLLKASKAYMATRKLADENRAALASKLNVEVYLAYIAFSLGLVGAALGRFDESAHWFESVRTDSAMADREFAVEFGMSAWLREAECLRLAGRTREASKVVQCLLNDTSDDQRPESVSSRAAEFQDYLLVRELPIIDWLESPEATAPVQPAYGESLRTAVAGAVAELVSSWERWRGDDYRSLHQQLGGQDGDAGIGTQPEFQSVLLDVWGRGGFLKVAAAIRAKPRAAIAVDAWSGPGDRLLGAYPVSPL